MHDCMSEPFAQQHSVTCQRNGIVISSILQWLA